MELWVILCNFWPILQKSSSIKPLTRNHSYLVWRVPRGLVSSLYKLGHCDLHLRFLLTIFVNTFSTSPLKPLHGFASNFVWMFLGWSPTKFVKSGVLPLFLMELWVILCIFWPILKKSSIKPLTRNHSNLVFRVPRGSSF